MNHNYQHIILNGEKISSTDITKQKAEMAPVPVTPAWEMELIQFLEEWFSDSDFIVAQTSGSTGQPQAICLQKTVMTQSARRTIDYFKLQQNDRILLSLPCRFIAGKMMVVRAIVGQMNLVSADPGTDFDFLFHESFDFGAMVPNQVFKLLESPSGTKKLENIGNLLVGGSSIPAQLEMQIGQLKNRVVSTYGMTETASHIAIRELSGEQRSDHYRCLPGITVSLNASGCLRIHTPELPDPLQTNDVAEVFSSTDFKILGRLDDVIISGGIKYWPESIETKLEDLIPVRFVISALPDVKLGEKIVLVVEGEPGSMDELLKEEFGCLTPFERPRAICYLEKFPVTSNNKIKRKEIKEAIRRF